MSVMEIKDFDVWNEDKKAVHSSVVRVRFKDREVWWCKVGINVGYEINGKALFLRPVLIIRKISSNTFIGIPLTRKEKGAIDRKGVASFYYSLGDIVSDSEGKALESLLELSQIRLFDTRRLVSRQYRMHEKTFGQVKEKLRELLLL